MIRGFISNIHRWLLAFISIALASGLAEGHSMKQVRAEITAKNGTWHGSIWLEAWALYPEESPKVPPGTPGDPHTAGGKWISTLNAADHEIMRDTAKMFLSETFALSLDGKKLPAEFSFPDYTTELPILKENDAGNALVKIDMSGEFPASTSGKLELAWMDDEDEPLVLKVYFPWAESRVIRLEARGEAVELMTITANGDVVAGKDSSLFAWIKAGFTHILPLGLDHICFILGLFFLQPKWKPLLMQTSAFTLAHSITLALAVLGIFTIPSSIVEPMIALSIAYVGIENLWVKELKPWRIGLVFGLGLLHGMGFASVMKELELPQGQVVKPLIGFNLGVECGQLTVLTAAFAVTFWFMKKPQFGIVRKIASGLIGAVGLYWTYERIFM